MPLLIGEAITGRELEEITSKWHPERFASMCDALAWAASGRQFITFPSFTSRVNAADGGIDAEWHIEIPDDGRAIPTPILSPGWNVFQYKKFDLISRDRDRIISKLVVSLRGTLQEISRRFNKTPDRYTLFVNLDLLPNQKKKKIKEAILTGFELPLISQVEILGAGELATLLNDNPHLRAAYFAPLSFKTWEEVCNAHRKHKFLGADVALIAREEEIIKLSSLALDKKVRIIVITGPHDIGKSRLVLEATKDIPHHVVMALDPRSMTLADYRGLSSSHREAVCIVEDPDPDSIVSLVNEVLSISNLKLVFTLPTPSHASAPSYGIDQRIASIHLKPLAEKSSRELLKATGQPLDFEIEDWIIRQAKGIPGILLAAASVGAELRREGGDFLSKVGKEFEKRIQSELGDRVLRAAELFSLLTHVGIAGNFKDEINHICEVFGDGWGSADALKQLEVLEQSGLAKRGGSFTEISLPILANYLVSKLLVGRQQGMFVLFAKLEEPGRIRFLRRLSEVQGPEVKQFWDELFGREGPLGNFNVAIKKAHLIHLLSGATPERTLRLLESGLLNSTREERLAIAGEERRELMWALEQLLFRLKTSRRALKLVWLLAEAENESYGNNATGVLEECFHPLHGQMPLPLNERIAVLKEFTSKGVSKEGKLVTVKAAGESSLRIGGCMIRHSIGPEPLDVMPHFTYYDFCNYARDLVDILISVARDEDPEVTTAALKVLPNLIAECGIQGRPQEAIDRFQILLDWAISGKPGLDIASLSNAIALMHHVLDERVSKPEYPTEKKEELKQFIPKLEELKNRLEGEDFSLRLKRWGGRWSTEDDDFINVNGKYLPKGELKLEKLAEDTVNNPHLLNYDLISWLLSDAAQNSRIFFYYLGLKDTGANFLRVIGTLGKQSDGSMAFSSYWGGWSQRDQASAEAHLEKLAAANAVTGEAIVKAIAWMGASGKAVEIVKFQIETERIDASSAGNVLGGVWTKKLTSRQFAELLKSIAGTNFENASIAIWMISGWLHYEHSLDERLSDFAWQCLESDPTITKPADEYDFDHRAAELARVDPDRGFQLLRTLLTREHTEGTLQHWDPISRYGRHQFWNALYQANKERLFESLFTICRANAEQRFTITWNLKEILDLEADKEIIISFAKRDEEFATIISESLTSAKPDFWPIAFALIQLYPANEEIKTYLAGGIEQRGDAVWGPLSEFYQGLRVEVETFLNDPNTPQLVQTWLREVANRLKKEISHEVVWEYDRNVNDLRRHIEDKDSSERIWAIGRVLKYGNPEDWKKLLSLSDIEDALPLIDVPEKKRKVIERALKVWRNGV